MTNPTNPSSTLWGGVSTIADLTTTFFTQTTQHSASGVQHHR